MRVNEKMKKLLSILLCLCMLLQNAPVMVFAATTDNLCDHHTEHTAECGYREGSAGSACTHEHSEDCYKIVACKHTHDDTCSSGCSHTCTVENGCITMELDCHHTHGDCGYAEAVAPQECTTCQSVLTHAENCGYVAPVAEVTCDCVPGEDGTLVHTKGCGYVAPVAEVKCACQPTVSHGGEGCTYVGGKAGSPCTHTHAVKVDSADSCYKLLCSHADGGHDDACGYAEAVEAHECHYECAECAAAAASEEAPEESSDPAPVCTCGTDDPAIHATTCAVYVAPENPVCYCAAKCTEPNEWCDVCGFDYTACGGTDTAAAYSDPTITGISVAVDGVEYTEGTVYINENTTSIVFTVTGSGFTSPVTFDKYFLAFAPMLAADIANSMNYNTNIAKMDYSSNLSWFTNCTNYRVQYSVDGRNTWINTDIYLTYGSEPAAAITGVSITVDGTTYTEGHVTIKSNSSVSMTVTGRDFDYMGDTQAVAIPLSDRSIIDYINAWNIDAAAGTATKDFTGNTGVFEGCSNSQIVYTHGMDRNETALYVTYENVTPAEITGVSIAVDKDEVGSGSMTIAPTSNVSVTVRGTDFENLGDRNLIRLAPGKEVCVADWTVDASRDIATIDLTDHIDWLASCDSFEIQYSNDGATTWISTELYLTYDESAAAARISGVSVTVDGTTYTGGNVTIKPDSKISFTVSGSDFQNLSQDNRLNYSMGCVDKVTADYGWKIDTSENTASWVADSQIDYFAVCSNFEVRYSNDGGTTWISTGIYLTYDDGIAEEDRAKIESVSVTVAGVTHTAGTVIIAPETESVTFTVAGTNFVNLSADHALAFGDGYAELLNSGVWTIDTENNTAVWTLRNTGDLFAQWNGYPVSYSNNYRSADLTWETSGISLTYTTCDHSSGEITYQTGRTEDGKHAKIYSCCGYVVAEDHTFAEGICTGCGLGGGYCGGEGDGTNLVWTLKDNALTISGTGTMADYVGENLMGEHAPWSGSAADITAVSIAGGVTHIGTFALYGLTGLKSITIPASVTELDHAAFKGCTELQTVTFAQGSGLTSIGEIAFENCTSLTQITIPVGVKNIGEDAFANCTSLTTVNVFCGWDGSLYTFGDTVTVNVADHSFTDGKCTVCGAECTCTVKCSQGSVNGECAVCTADPTGCTGTEAYTVTIAADIANGTVTAQPDLAEAGQTVTLTAENEPGYMFYGWTVTDAQDNPVEVVNDQFTMPPCAVTVSADFSLCYHVGSDHKTGTPTVNDQHIYQCTICKEESVVEQCSGGTEQTCKGYECVICGAWYGEANPDAHTFDSTGKCSDCGTQAVAQVGDTFYETIHKALRAAEGINGCTLTLLDNITIAPGNTAPYVNKGTFTLDLNGNTISSNASTLQVMNTANLTIKDSVGGGKIVSTYSNAIYQTGGKLTIESGTFEGTFDGVFLSYDSTLIVKGGTFIGSRAMITGFGSNVKIDLTAIDPTGFTLKNNGNGTFAPNLPEGYAMVSGSGEVVTSLSAEESATVKASLENATVTLDKDTFTYDGKEHKPTVTVVLGDKPLTLDVDYTVIYAQAMAVQDGKPFKWFGTGPSESECINAGSLYFAVVEGIGNYYTEDTFTLCENFVIAPRPLTVKADDQTILVGGQINEESVTVTEGSLVAGHTLTASIQLGQYTEAGSVVNQPGFHEDVLTILKLSCDIRDGEEYVTDNYSISFVSGNLTVVEHVHEWSYSADGATITAECKGTIGTCPIGKQTVTVKAEGKTYDGTPVTAELDGSIDGVTAPEITYTGNTNAGTHTASITIEGKTASVEFTIEKATVTVTADAKSKPYGTDNPALTYTASGLVGGYDTLTGALETTATKTSNVGEYDITVGSLAGSNYTINFVGAKLTITKAAAPEIQWPTAAALTYGQKLSDSTLTSQDENGTFAWQDGSIVPTVKNNGYVVVYTPKDTDNYDYTGVELTKTIPVTVSKAEPSIVWKSGYYNTYSTNMYITASVNGVDGEMIPGTAVATVYDANGNALNSVTCTKTDSTGTYFFNWLNQLSDGTYLTPGEYLVKLTYQGSDNYGEKTVEMVTYTIHKRALTVTANDNAITYGDAPSANGVEYSGFVDGETEAVLGGELTYSYNYEQYGNVGTYTITPSGLTSGNYDITFKTGKLTVNAKGITVTADAVSKTYGDADPELTYTASGLVNGDKLSGALTREVGTDIGTYAITQGTLTAGSNYTINYTGATLTINKKPITEADVTLNGSLTYTGSEQTQPITVTEGITYELTGNKATNVGSYVLTVKGTGNHTGSITLDWTIAKAKLTITADNKVIYIGERLPTLTYTVSGLVVGDKLTKEPALTTNADADQAGSYTITVANADAGMNYAITYVGGTLTIMDKNTEVETKVETAALTEVPDGLKNTKFNTVEAIKQELTSRIVATFTGFVKENMAHYDVTLQFSLDGGENWIIATEENFPTEGITVTLPYPNGTNAAGYDFVVSHMFTVTSRRLGTTAGDVELPSVTEAASGIRVTLKGLSPVTLAWRATEFDVKIAGTTNGTVSTNVSKATSGTEVTVTVTPKYGYKMATLTVKDASGKSYAVSTDNSGKYYFTMPADDVTVTATFSKISSSTADTTNPKTGDDFNIGIWSAVMLMSSLSLVTILFEGKRRRYTK